MIENINETGAALSLAAKAQEELYLLKSAIRNSFPHFQFKEEVTPDAMRNVGKEYEDMCMNWSPNQADIQFSDANGRIAKIVYDAGEPDVGILGGWALEDGVVLADEQ